jgi:hypothetical protein
MNRTLTASRRRNLTLSTERLALFENQNSFLDSVAKGVSAFANSGGGSLVIGVQHYPTPVPDTSTGIPIDTAILPGCHYNETKRKGCMLRPSAKTQEALQAKITKILGGLVVTFTLATETSPGERTEIALASHVDPVAIAAVALAKVPAFFAQS